MYILHDLATFTMTILILIIFQMFDVLPFCSSASTATFVFGDSLVDAGNNNFLFSLSKANSPPYGIDFKPSQGKPTGRFTNGRTISDIIGEALGGNSFPPPYLAPNVESNATHIGINYASGSSGILDATGTLFIGRVPLSEQISNFEESRRYIVNSMGEENAKKFLKKAMFSITIGSNDFINYFQPSIPFMSDEKVSPTIFQDFLISNFSMNLQRLHKLGARKFVVVGVGPLGCIPFIRAIGLISKGKCSVEVNTLIRNYNKKLKMELHRLNKDMEPKAIFIYANSYDVFREIILNYKQHGFENADAPCCGGYFPPFVCYKGKNGNTSSVMCEDRGKYVFWDAYHPTEAANVIIAKKFLYGDPTVISPINILHLHNYAS
ncbi:GDSL esterase/lipase At5g41890 isoform X2 [Solanum dulcamara]|uniref:GDSL esterase/lipase At5g41890 isoform X2 n=1 Tax=Solanum dulcamara TaxID=45834 RepID=UPI002485A540|nr:GDSL esterase/lipase At5g41890 isoform X2 [Solanum dulcamara]